MSVDTPAAGPTSLQPVPGGRLPRSERREAILARALPLFAERGYEGTTTRDLARALGVTEPVLYRHFPSKRALFLAVLARAEARILGALAAALGAAEGARARLHALAEGIGDLLAKVGLELRLLHGAAAAVREPRIVTAVRATYARLAAANAEALKGPGLRRGLSAADAGTFLLEVGVGASLLRPLRVPALHRDGYGAAAERMLLAALT
jgi:AcrR family transcriptional regulator